MRVIAGEARGQHLKAPASSSIRPTSDRVRSAIFSMVEATGTEMEKVLDLYAGTGAFGIEALSRGAGWADFVEQDPRHAAVIKANLINTGLEARGRVLYQPVEKALDTLEGTYDVIFMDPPYGDAGLKTVLQRISASSLTRQGTMIVVEHSKREALDQRYGDFLRAKERRYGDTVVSIFQRR